MNTYVVFMPPRLAGLGFAAENRLASNQAFAETFVASAFDAGTNDGMMISGMNLMPMDEVEDQVSPRYLNGLDAVIVEASDAVAERMIGMGGVVVPNFVIEGVMPIDPPIAPLATVPNDWHLTKVGSRTANQRGYTGVGQIVGILDTGIDAKHPEFSGKNIYFQEFDALGKPVASAAHDAGYHGTHVCGTVAGLNVGVAPRADLAVACVLNGPNGSGSFAGIAAGLNWLATTTFNGQNVDVVSASLGAVGYFAQLYLPISNARAIQDLLFIGAIGNAGGKGINHHGSPGNYDISLGIGATDVNDNVSPFSDWGTVPQHGGIRKPEMCAPGENIHSSLPSGGYGLLSGTSMATPCVAGAAALVLQKYPAMRSNPAGLQAKLQSMIVPITPAARAGAGRLDLTSI